MENYTSASNECLENTTRLNYENDFKAIFGIPDANPICESNPINGLYPMIWTLKDRVEFTQHPISVDSVVINTLYVEKIIEEQDREILEKAHFPKEIIDDYIKTYGIQIGFAMLGILYWYMTGEVNELIDVTAPAMLGMTFGTFVHFFKELLSNPRELFQEAQHAVPSFRQKLAKLDMSTLTPTQRRHVEELKSSLNTTNRREMTYVTQTRPMTFEFIYKHQDPLIKRVFKKVHERTHIPYSFLLTDELKDELDYSIKNKLLCEGKIDSEYILTSLQKNNGILLSRSMFDGYNAIVGIVLFELFPEYMTDLIYIDVFCSGTCTKNIGAILMLLMKHIVWVSQFDGIHKPNVTFTIRLNSVKKAVGFYLKQGFLCETLAVQGKKRKTKKRSKKMLRKRHSRKH